jgi:thiol-disulfide isomerase/thioredoxin
MRKLLFIAVIALFACTDSADKPSKTEPHLHYGHWLFTFDLNGTSLHQPVIIDSTYSFTFINDDERITTDPAVFSRDSIFVDIPVYHSYLVSHDTTSHTLTGAWHYPDRKPGYHISFTAKAVDANTIDLGEITDTLRYAVTFSPKTEDAYPAVGQFYLHANGASGTFLTETGDYRFLHGSQQGDSLFLQCFDGSHVFHFAMHMTGDSLTGTFKSGVHWEEPFTGVLDPAADLRDPYQITQLTSDDPLQITATDLDGNKARFNNEWFKDSVTIVQIFGSWCPNCLDESRYYTELHKRYSSKGLRILPIAYERTTNVNENKRRLTRYIEEIHLPFPVYVGGRASKSEASNDFPMLNSISSFPTSLLVDKQGKIRAIHTGFNGPGTGAIYDAYRVKTEALIDSLLDENP